jgi:quercetin dioxygenase-like cupin family protein
MSEQEVIEKLESEGYDKVYVWKAGPNEEDPDHTHDFDVKLAVVEGSVEIKVNGQTLKLKNPDTVQIPKSIVHSALVSPEGCTYVVGERHSA